MKYAITFFLVVVLAIVPQRVTTATRATQHNPANVPKTHDVPKVGAKIPYMFIVSLNCCQRFAAWRMCRLYKL